MKNGRQTRTIGEMCEVINGGTPKTGVPEYWDGSHLWITPAEMGKRLSPYVSETERKITDLGLRNSSAQMLQPKSVILSSRAPIGHLVINTEPMATNQGCKGLVPASQLHHKFLYYYLTSIVDLLNSLGTGATFKELSGGKLKEVEIPFLQLPEQERIVRLLDKAFASIATAKASAEANLKSARGLFESELQLVLSQRGPGWVEKPFAELCNIKHGYAFEGEFFSTEGEYVLLTPGNFYETGGYRDRGEKQKYYSGEIPRDYVLDEGDLLVAMTEQAAGLLGSPILVPESDKFLHNQRLGLVLKKPGVAWTNEFFFHVFNMQSVRKAIHASASGVKVRHTSPTKIGEVVVGFPTSLADQKRIVSTLASLAAETNHLVSIYERKLAALEALKKSLLHQAFSGELTDESSAPGAVTFPRVIANVTPTDMHAGILALAYKRHENRSRERTFGHVKAEKIAHMVESHVGIDCGRNPVKDAAGPNDYRHLKQVEHRAEKAGYFSFKQNATDSYTFRKLRRFDQLTEKTRAALGDEIRTVDQIIDLMVPMQTQQAEIFATVYAAWNNLLLDGKPISDEAIVSEAREKWHRAKLKIPRDKFFKAIDWMREKNVVPKGRGKRVVSRTAA